MTIESINGFRIGDKVRLKDGDGRPHIIKSFEIDGWHGFFVVAHFEDAASTMIDNLSLLEPQGVDEAAIKYLRQYDKDNDGEEPCATEVFRAGVKFQAEQGYSREVEVKVDAGGYPYINEIELYDYDNDKPLAKKGDKVRIQITKL